MNGIVLARIVLIVLHNVDGEEVAVNPEHIVALNYTKEASGSKSNTLIAGGHKCVISLSNGKFVSVVEPCGMVRQAINEAQR